MAIFEGDPQGSPNNNYMAVISDWNYNVWDRDPWRIPQFLASAQLLYGDTPTMTRIGMHKGHMEY